MAKTKNEKETERKVFDFSKLEVEGIQGTKEAMDISRIVGNWYYQNTSDIGQMEKAREIYKTGKTEFGPIEQKIFLTDLEMSTVLPAVLKVAISKMFNS